MSGHTLRDRFRYSFDNFMSRGGSSIFISLVIVFLVLWVGLSAIRVVTYFTVADDVERHGQQYETEPWQLPYVTFLQMTDAGNMNHDLQSDDRYKISAVFAGVAGLIMLSSLIAFITTALDQKIADLRKGHSRVIEEGHTLILGWNDRVPEILRELTMANESEDDPCVVILSKHDKEWMDDYLKLNIPDTQNTRVVTRSGPESSLVNLDIVSVTSCKSCIVLASCDASDTDEAKSISDAVVTKSILAVVASRGDDHELSIVAEVFEQRNREIVEAIAPGEVTTLDANEILAKILVQTSRSVGLSVVYGEMLSFDGCEMYFTEAKWNDLTFGDLQFHFPDGVPMGIRRADGELILNPPIDTPVGNDDSVLILAEDDSTIEFRKKPVAAAREIDIVDKRIEPRIERELLIGWTPKAETILREYDDYTLDGSSVDIILRIPDDSIIHEIERIDKELPGLDVRLIDVDPMRSEGLVQAEPFKYDNIIILGQSGEGEEDSERIDSETIIILLLLRNIFSAFPEESANTKLITEVLDSENQALVARTGVNDFIISNRFISMLLAQISEDREIKRVYDDLFSEDGSEIYLKPAWLYFESFPQEVTFADIMRIAQKREEVCLGIKLKEHEQNMDRNYGVQLIPLKTDKFTINAEDSLVVLAEDDT